jgi:hypothetical protein
MRRTLYLLGFISWGLFVTWASLFFVARIDWSKFVTPHPASGCFEIGHCDVPWFIVVWFFVALLLPTVAHAVVGWRLEKLRVTPVRFIFSLLVLSVATLAFYVITRAISAYKIGH